MIEIYGNHRGADNPREQLRKDIEADAFDIISRLYREGKSVNEMATTIAGRAVTHALYHLVK
jgi:hypothetical protein